MIDPFYTAVSGLNVNRTSVKVTANNVANTNTTGFKASKTSSANVTSTGNSQSNMGSMVSNISPRFTQGSILSTSNPLDLAIDGQGFFIVEDSKGFRSFTRDGSLTVDNNGYLATSDGRRVQGHVATSGNSLSAQLSDLRIGNSNSNPVMTENVNLSVNLNASEPTIANSFTISNNQPQNYNFSTTVQAFDSQGGAHDVNIYFSKTGNNAWEANYATRDGNGNLVSASSPQSLTFDTNGALVSDSQTPVQFNFGGNTVNPQSIAFDYGVSQVEGGSGSGGTTQFAVNSQVTNISQDGNGSGSFTGVNIDRDGVITGSFSNGQSGVIGQIAMARFNAPQNLSSMGGNFYNETNTSGAAIIGAPGTGGLGSVLSSSLESSNVDLAGQFINLMTAQRAFEANLKTVSTGDEMAEELLSIKR